MSILDIYVKVQTGQLVAAEGRLVDSSLSIIKWPIKSNNTNSNEL